MRCCKFNYLSALLVVSLIAAYAFFIVLSVDHETPRVISLRAAPDRSAEDQTIIKVMNYNIAHARGYLSMYELSDYDRNFEIRSEQEVTDSLDKISELVVKENIDILVLEEADFATTWSFNVDEAAYIGRKAGFSSVVEGLKWSLNLPWIRIRSGQAILSKYPVVSARVSKFGAETFWRSFVGGDSYLDVVYSIRGKPVRVLGTHLESGDLAKREAEAMELIDASRSVALPLIVAGDMNAVTPEAKEDSDYLKDKFLDNTIESFINSGVYDFNTGLLRPTDESMYTYSAEDPHRLIDYIFTTPDLEVTEYYVVRKNLSDHFPLVARIIV